MSEQALTYLRAPGKTYRRLVVPFVNTSPVTDLGCLFMLLPVWWFIGIEQFIWPFWISWIGLKVLIQKNFKLRIVPALRWMLLFFGVCLISGLFVESARIISFVRGLSSYMMAFFILLVLTNSVERWEQIRFLLKAIVITLLLSGVVGALGFLGIWQPQFKSLAGMALGGSIEHTISGGRIAFRTTGAPDWFTLLGPYFRVQSFFLYPTHFASALVVGLPSLLLLFKRSQGVRRWPKLLAVGGLLCANLVYTTGRVAMASFLLGAAFYLLFYSKVRKVLILLLVLAALPIAFDRSVVSAQSEVDEVLYARGEGSYNTRTMVYEETIVQALERPVFGWGTPRGEQGGSFSKHPAGSHSHYLGVLYKHGFVGLTVFFAILWAIWTHTRPPEQEPASPQDEHLRAFLQHGRWVFVTVFANSFTDALDGEGTTMALIWLTYGLLLAARQLYEGTGDKSQVTGYRLQVTGDRGQGIREPGARSQELGARS